MFTCSSVAEREGVFGRRLVAGAFVFSAGLGLVATNCVNAFSYGYDKLRFIKPVFIGDTIYSIRTNLDPFHQWADGALLTALEQVDFSRLSGSSEGLNLEVAEGGRPPRAIAWRQLQAVQVARRRVELRLADGDTVRLGVAYQGVSAAALADRLTELRRKALLGALPPERPRRR